MGHQHVGFGKWAHTYDGGIQGKVARWFYRAVLTSDIWSGCRVLDVGCGTGRLLTLLADRGAIGSGVDVSPEMVAVAQAANPQMDIREGTAEHLPFEDAAFDMVVTCLAYHHMDARETFLAEAVRVLVPGGRVVIVEPRLGVLRRLVNAAFGAHGHVERFATAGEIRADLTGHGLAPVRTRTHRLTLLVEAQAEDTGDGS
ncbi:MAG: class I SAM-dependent methyltransferase [Micrococcales bacterium]|nr:class I SAM-dependent methyltransferase [Micrococcales bacterium]